MRASGALLALAGCGSSPASRRATRRRRAVAPYDGGTPNNTTDLVVSSGKGPEPFAHLVLFYGWGTGSAFPGDGWVPQDCGGGATCFYQDDQHSLSLDQVADHDHGVITFRLREALPPPAPSCDPSVFTARNT
jgi:hypothetical protein